MHFRLVPDNRYYLLYDMQIHKSAPIDSEKNQTSNFGNVQNLTFAFFSLSPTHKVALPFLHFVTSTGSVTTTHLNGNPERGNTIFHSG